MPLDGVVHTGYEPHHFQAEIHDKLRRFSVLVCHRRFGKTVLACNVLINAALTIDNGTFLYVAPYQNQARSIAWPILLQSLQPLLAHDAVKLNLSESTIQFPNGSIIKMAGSDNDQAMRGLGITGAVMDEIADFRPGTWPEVVRPAVSADRQGRKGFVLFIGTPKGANQFLELYTHAQNDDDWYAAMYRADETDLPWLDQTELDMARATMSDNQYRQEYLCDFTASADNILITIDQVSDAMHRHFHEQDLATLPKVLGVDVARFGDDRSSIIRRHGFVAYKPMVLEQVDNMHLAGVVAQQIEDFRPDAVFIDGGRGEGVIDRLRQIGHDVIEVQFGARPINPRYTNLRSEMWDSMARWIREGGVLPSNATDLKVDLCVPTYSFDGAGRMKLEPKEKITERGMRSPDLADALACTFAMPVVSKQVTAGGQAKPNIVSDHSDYLS